MSNKVIITADDYGVCNTIDNAIIEAVRAKKVTSVSAVVTHATSVERIKVLMGIQNEMRQKGFEFGIGLHFCITSGNPLYTVNGKRSSLADPDDEKGRFREAPYYKFRDIQAHHLRQELMEQFDRLNKTLDGVPIDHLTNHHGIVYFDKDMYNEYVQTAGAMEVPIRSPMSWYRKFKKVSDLPDFDNHDIGNPTMRRGLKIRMWRKLSQMSYGNFLKRMKIAEDLNVNYPDVLCEYIYGQCAEDINKGVEVLEHVLEKYTKRNPKQTVIQAHKYTVKKSRKGKLDNLAERYQNTLKNDAFSMELMFHLANAHSPVTDLQGIDDDPEPHGINLGYFDTREREWITLKGFSLDKYEGVNYVPYKSL